MMKEKKKVAGEEYCFLQEAVQEQGLEKHSLPVKRIIYVIVLAFVFGVVASVAFWKVQDILGERDARIYRANLLKNAGSTQEKQAGFVKKSDEYKIAAYEDYWKRIAQIGIQCNKSVVSVGEVHTESWYQKNQKGDEIQSGLVFKKKGNVLYILTQPSSMAEKKVLQVEFADGTKAAAELVDVDRNTEIAVLCVDGKDISKSTMKKIEEMDFTQYAAELSPKLSDRILLFGSPNGLMKSVMLGNIVNADLSVQTVDKNLSVYATDVAYTEGGNGFAADVEGRIVGIITDSYQDVTGETNWSFVSVTDIAATAQAIVDHKQAAYLGIQGKDAGDNDGVYVTEVALKSPAYHGGIRVADRIYSIDGNRIGDMKDLSLFLSTHEQGDRLKIRLCRENGSSKKHRTVKITLD